MIVSTALPLSGVTVIVTLWPRATDTEPGETCPPPDVLTVTSTSSGSGSGSRLIFLLQLPRILGLQELHLPVYSSMLLCNLQHQMLLSDFPGRLFHQR